MKLYHSFNEYLRAQEPEDSATLSLHRMHEKNRDLIKQYYDRQQAALEEKELDKKLEKALDKAVEKAFEEMFADFLKK